LPRSSISKRKSLSLRRFDDDDDDFEEQRKTKTVTTRAASFDDSVDDDTLLMKNEKKREDGEKEEEKKTTTFVTPQRVESWTERKSRFEKYTHQLGEEKKERKKKKMCEVCEGEAKVACTQCFGFGWVNENERLEMSEQEDLKSWFPSWCGHCRGSGVMWCARCFGSGEFRHPIGFRLFGKEEEEEEEEE
jgi:hypothetical protein